LAIRAGPPALQEQEQCSGQDGSHRQGHQQVQWRADWPATARYPRCLRGRKVHNRSRVHRLLLPGISPTDSEGYRIRRFSVPTRAVWERSVAVPPGVLCQDEAGRLWNVAWLLACVTALLWFAWSGAAGTLSPPASGGLPAPLPPAAGATLERRHCRCVP